VRPEHRQWREHRLEARRHRGAAKGSRAARDDGDADLHRREEPLGVLPQALDRGRRATAPVDEFTQPRLAHIEHRDLGACEDTVDQRQREENQKLY
jgi:hypothetical protein